MAVQSSPMTVGKLACCAMWLQEIDERQTDAVVVGQVLGPPRESKSKHATREREVASRCCCCYEY